MWPLDGGGGPFPKQLYAGSRVHCGGMLACYLCTAVGTFSCGVKHPVRRGGVEPAPGFT